MGISIITTFMSYTQRSKEKERKKNIQQTATPNAQ